MIIEEFWMRMNLRKMTPWAWQGAENVSPSICWEPRAIKGSSECSLASCMLCLLLENLLLKFLPLRFVQFEFAQSASSSLSDVCRELTVNGPLTFALINFVWPWCDLSGGLDVEYETTRCRGSVLHLVRAAFCDPDLLVSLERLNRCIRSNHSYLFHRRKLS